MRIRMVVKALYIALFIASSGFLFSTGVSADVKAKRNSAIEVEKLKPFRRFVGQYVAVDKEGSFTVSSKKSSPHHGVIKRFDILMNRAKDAMFITPYLGSEEDIGLSYAVCYCSIHKSWEISTLIKRDKATYQHNQVPFKATKGDYGFKGYFWEKMTGEPPTGKLLYFWWNEEKKIMELNIRWHAEGLYMVTKLIGFKKVA